MDRPLLVLMACFRIAPVVYSQPSQGNMMLGGAIGFRSASYQGNDYINNQEFRFPPSFGYFINDNFAPGVTMGLSRYRSGTAAELSLGWLSLTSYNPDAERDNDNQSHVDFSMNSFSPSLGVRYHFKIEN